MLIRKISSWPTSGWESPSDEMEKLKRQMALLAGRLTNSHLGEQFAGVFPLINVTEDTNNFYIRAELPGFAPEELQISVAGDSITLSGERKIEPDVGNVKYHRKEREAGKFNRVINVPGQIDSEKTAATCAHGVLTITLPKSELSKPRQISIKGA